MNDLVKDVEINSHVEKFLVITFIAAFVCLALGATTSISILAGFHIFMIPSILYFLTKANYKNYPKSAWFLLLFSIAIILSIVVNQDIIANGYKNIGKVKYFLYGFFGIAPIAWFSKKHLTKKHVSIFLYILFIATTIGTISGLIGKFYGINPITMKAPNILERNSGMMGMVMNYAHNLSFFLIINVGLILYRERTKEYVNLKFIVVCLAVNLIGFYLTYTRGAWLGFAIGVPFLMLSKISLKKFAFAFLLSITLLAGLYLASGKFMVRVDNDMTRISQWRAGIEAFKDRPLLGYGYLNFEPSSVKIKEEHGFFNPRFQGHAHNNFVEVLSTTGIFGFAFFVFWIVSWLGTHLKSDKTFSICTVSLLITFVVGGVTQSTISLGINLFFIVGIYTISFFNLSNTSRIL